MFLRTVVCVLVSVLLSQSLTLSQRHGQESLPSLSCHSSIDKKAEEAIFHMRQAESLKASLAVRPPAVSKTVTNGSPCIPDIRLIS